MQSFEHQRNNCLKKYIYILELKSDFETRHRFLKITTFDYPSLLGATLVATCIPLLNKVYMKVDLSGFQRKHALVCAAGLLSHFEYLKGNRSNIRNSNTCSGSAESNIGNTISAWYQLVVQCL